MLAYGLVDRCATLKVTGSGSSTPSGDQTASIPGVYSMDGEYHWLFPILRFLEPCPLTFILLDPAINIDIYSNENADVTVSIYGIHSFHSSLWYSPD